MINTSTMDLGIGRKGLFVIPLIDATSYAIDKFDFIGMIFTGQKSELCLLDFGWDTIRFCELRFKNPLFKLELRSVILIALNLNTHKLELDYLSSTRTRVKFSAHLQMFPCYPYFNRTMVSERHWISGFAIILQRCQWRPEHAKVG